MLACHTNFLFRKIAHLYLVFLHFYVAGMSKKGKIIKEIKKSEERRKSIQNTRVVKESVLIQYANSLTDIFNHITKTYEIDPKSNSAKNTKDMITEWKNRGEVTLLNIHTIEENLEKLIKEADKNLYQSIAQKMNFDK